MSERGQPRHRQAQGWSVWLQVEEQLFSFALCFGKSSSMKAAVQIRMLFIPICPEWECLLRSCRFVILLLSSLAFLSHTGSGFHMC